MGEATLAVTAEALHSCDAAPGCNRRQKVQFLHQMGTAVLARRFYHHEPFANKRVRAMLQAGFRRGYHGNDRTTLAESAAPADRGESSLAPGCNRLTAFDHF
jgi:hypothetical protein